MSANKNFVIWRETERKVNSWDSRREKQLRRRRLTMTEKGLEREKREK